MIRTHDSSPLGWLIHAILTTSVGLMLAASPTLHAAELQRVMVGPFPDRASANRVVRQIQAQDIDSYVMAATDDHHWLSAGVFRQADNARTMQQRIASLNLEVPSVVVQGLQTDQPGLPSTPAPTPQTSPTSPTSGALVLGSAPEPTAPSERPPAEAVRYGVDRVRLEASALTRSSRPADGGLYLRAEPYVLWSIDESWEARAGARLDGYRQIGNQRVSTLDVDYAETYLRYRDSSNRITLGTQSVVWGRIDELSPNDQLSVLDFSRAILDDPADRRRVVPALRWEHFRESGNHDLVWIPRFRAAEQADANSLWALVNRHSGRLPGLPFDPVIAPLISSGRFSANEPRSGGVGWRFSRWQRGLDYAVNVLYTPHSLPYFTLSDPARMTLLSGGDPQALLSGAEPAFNAHHPRTWVIGGDAGFETGGATWRFELAWLSDVPVTRRDTLTLDTRKALRWAAGAEWFPGDADLRVNLQLIGEALIDAGPVLDRTSTLILSGDIEEVFVPNYWQGRLRFALGLDQSDRYVNPELSYIGAEPHEIYLGYHHFSGAERSIGGFYQHNDVITLGVRTRF